MDFATYQQLAARTTNPALSPDDRLFDAVAGLAEEAGEVLAAVRKHRFQERALRPDAVLEELGDALWCLTTAAAALGSSLDEVAARNLAKLTARYPTGFDRASGAGNGPP
jgi:NTP pyrophosphatase (non-canonical NTP hydrolase)